jgi:hypothetical protein
MPPRLIWIFYHFLFACFCEKRPLNIKVWRKLSNFEVWIWMWRLIFLIYHEMWYDNNQNLFVRPCAFDVLSKVFHPAQLHIRPFLCTYLEDHSRVTIIIFRRPYLTNFLATFCCIVLMLLWWKLPIDYVNVRDCQNHDRSKEAMHVSVQGLASRAPCMSSI